MSEIISSLSLEQVNKITEVLIKDGILVDLIKQFPQINQKTSLGYYFCDRQEKIVAGNIISLNQNKHKMPKSWLTIPFQEIPDNAVTLIFFYD